MTVSRLPDTEENVYRHSVARRDQHFAGPRCVNERYSGVKSDPAVMLKVESVALQSFS